MGRTAFAIQWRESTLAAERQKRQAAVDEFTQRLKQHIQPKGIMLFGSVARGLDQKESDVDIVVVGGQLPEKMFDRLDALADLRWGIPVSIDAFPYTEAEFEKMLDNRHVTALDCMYEGKVLHGQEYFDRLRPKFDAYVARGLTRGKAAWYFEKQITDVR